MHAITNTWTTVCFTANAGYHSFRSLAPLMAKIAAVALSALKWGLVVCMLAPIVAVPVLLLIPSKSNLSSSGNPPTPSLVDRTLQALFSVIFVEETKTPINIAPPLRLKNDVSNINSVQSTTRITVGCTNVGASCWLNASLNLMAGTTHFDDLLNFSFPPEQPGDSTEATKLRELVPFLKTAVNNLRTAIPVNGALARVILQKIGKARYVLDENMQVNMRIQHEPAEFFQQLLQDWYVYSQTTSNNCQPPLRPNILTKYEPIGNHGRSKATVCRSSEGIIDVGINPNLSHTHLNDADLVDQNACLDLDSIIRTTQEEIFELDGNDTTERAEFRRIDFFDKNNRRAIINVKRRAAANVRLGNPININPDCTVTLGGEPYRIQGSLIHHGDAHWGHWFYVEANKTDGKFYAHNDSDVYEVPSLNGSRSEGGIGALRRGNIFFVEKIAVPLEN